MEAKKNPKLSLKILNDEFKQMKEELKEVKYLKEKVSLLEKRLAESEIKTKKFEENPSKNLDKDINQCKKCDKSYDSGKNLKMHLRDMHPITIQCSFCENSFVNNCELEDHIKSCHSEIKPFECDQCEKKFVLRWRMEKHRINHTDQNMKKCHYFNNGKVCPFEDIGCMFAHVISGDCKFGNACRNKLCSFRHTFENERNLDKLKEAFEKLSDDEQHESREVLCDYICAAPDGYHKCFSDEDYKRFDVCDLTEFTELYDPFKKQRIECFPCIKCRRGFKDCSLLKEHFQKCHDEIKHIDCPVSSECEYASESVDTIVMHIGIEHKELVREKLR